MSKYTTRDILEMIEANGGTLLLDLSNKDLSGLDLSREMIQSERKRFQGASGSKTPVWYSDYTNGIDLKSVNLQGARLLYANLTGADLRYASLQGADLEQAVLRDTALVQADLRETILIAVDFCQADLVAADLRESDLHFADFHKTVLGLAHLEGLDFVSVKRVDGARFFNAFLDRTRIKREQLGEQIPEESAGAYTWAKETYLLLKTNFEQLGRYDDASWAYRKERRMEKREAWLLAKDAFRERDWHTFLGKGVKVIGDLIAEFTCDYGEGIWQVMRAMLLLWVVFAVFYGAIYGVLGPAHWVGPELRRDATRHPVDMLLFSIGVTSRMPAGLEAQPILAMRILMAVEAILGTVLAGLLGFVLGNRIRRS